MSIQKNIVNDFLFQVLADQYQRIIQDRKLALELIVKVAEIHRLNPRGSDRGFEGQKQLAFFATQYWREKYGPLKDKEKKSFDYIESIKP